MRLATLLLPLFVVGLVVGVKSSESESPSEFDLMSSVELKRPIPELVELQPTLIPSNYQLEYRVPLSSMTNDTEQDGRNNLVLGNAIISGVNRVTSSNIVLNAFALFIKGGTIMRKPGGEIDVISVQPVFEGKVVLELNDIVLAGEELEISLAFATTLSPTCEYAWAIPLCSDNINEKSKLRVGQYVTLVPNHDVLMFPNFYWPGEKATFDLTLIHPQGSTAISNSPLVSSEPDPLTPGWIKDTFKRILLKHADIGFFISDFGPIEATNNNNTAKVYVSKPTLEKESAKFQQSAQMLAKIIGVGGQYLNDSGRVSKMDLAILPSGGGWVTRGVAVYNTDRHHHTLEFPYDEEEIATLESYRKTMSITYLMTRQWLGEYWNEHSGWFSSKIVARFLQYVFLQEVNPDIQGTETVILRDLHTSMEGDVGTDVDALSEADFYEPFGDIGIGKGVPIMRMVESVLAPRTMGKGIGYFVNKVEHLNRTPADTDLNDCLEQARKEDGIILPKGLTVPEFIKHWADQPGVPLVNVSRVNDTHVSVSQRRFNKEGAPHNGSWWIPVTYITGAGNEGTVWLSPDDTSSMIAHNSSTWIFINPNSTGYYRAVYDEKLLHQILQLLESDPSRLSGMSLSRLVDDSITFYNQVESSSYINASSMLSLMRRLDNETHLGVWRPATSLVFDISRRFSSNTSNDAVVKEYFRERVERAFINVKSKVAAGEQGAMEVLSNELLKLACRFRSPLCANYMKQQFSDWKATNSDSFEYPYLCEIVASGGQEAFDFAFAKHKKYERISSDETERLIDSLGCVTESRLIGDLLNKTFNNSGVNFIASMKLLRFMSRSNPDAINQLLEVLVKKSEEIFSMWEGDSSLIQIMDNVASHAFTEDRQKQVKDILEANRAKLKGKTDDVARLLKKVENNILWMKTTGHDVISWIAHLSLS